MKITMTTADGTIWELDEEHARALLAEFKQTMEFGLGDVDETDFPAFIAEEYSNAHALLKDARIIKMSDALQSLLCAAELKFTVDVSGVDNIPF